MSRDEGWRPATWLQSKVGISRDNAKSVMPGRFESVGLAILVGLSDMMIDGLPLCGLGPLLEGNHH